MARHTDTGATPGHVDRRFAKAEAAHRDALTGPQEALLALDRKRERRQQAMALAAVQKARPLRPPCRRL